MAEKLSRTRGVLEPLQTEPTVAGQVAELKSVLQANGDPPIVLIGHSWGAMLGFIFAAMNPSLVKKLIMVGSGVYEDMYAPDIARTRFARLTEEERAKVDSLSRTLADPDGKDKDMRFAQLGELLSRADSYDPLAREPEVIEYRYDIFERTWTDAEEMRSSGELLALGKRIQCPVVAIHGDYDPHPAEGVKAPLSRVLKDFRFISLENCGHKPWVERRARDFFYEILENELIQA